MPDRRRLALCALAGGVFAACSKAPPPPPPPSIAEGLAAVTVSVDSTPQGARVLLDGEDTGKLTPARLQVDTGKDHRVALRHPEYREYATSFFAAPNAPVEVRAALPPGALLEIRSEPPGALVQVDGEATFTAPGRSAALAPGKHVVFVRAPGHVTLRRVLDLGEGTRPVSVALRPGRDAAVSSEPPGAQILVDGVDAGATTPATVVLPLGRGHRLEVRRARYAAAARALPEIRPGKPLAFAFKLEDAAALALDARIVEVARRLERAERVASRLQRQQSGMVLKRSAVQERALARSLEEEQDRVDELSEELARLRQERLELERPGP